MKNLLIGVIALFCLSSITAQVGIGTTTPTAQLDIQSTDTGIPTLMLNPQTAPVGTDTGQFAVVEDMLYMYDSTRSKWLSVESTVIQVGRDGGRKGELLRFPGEVRDDDSGARMPFNGTIVYATVSTSTSVTNAVEIWVRDGATTVSDFSFNLVAGNYTNTNMNLDFNAGDYIQVYLTNDGDKRNAVASVWVKWRL